MTKTERPVRHVVVHPLSDAPADMLEQWSRRLREVDTVEYNRNNGGTQALDAAHFMDDWDRTPTGSIVAVSGQMASACVKRLLETLARHPRTKRGMVSIVVEDEATMKKQPNELIKAVREVNNRHGSTIRIVPRAK